jgi:hypothetical protein
MMLQDIFDSRGVLVGWHAQRSNGGQSLHPWEVF